MDQAAATNGTNIDLESLREQIRQWPDPLWTPMPVPPWSIDAPTYTTSARTGYKEILPDEELDRSIFHAAQVCNLITQFTTEPYHNAGLADIMSFLQLGPRSRSTHLSAEGSIFGFGWNVVLPLPTWSLLFQMAIGADACTRLHNLGFDRILRPRVMDFEAECARLAAEMETRGKEEAATTKEHDAAAAKGAETACAQSETQDEMKANSARDDEEVAVLYSNNASVEMDTSAEEETKADKGNQTRERHFPYSARVLHQRRPAFTESKQIGRKHARRTSDSERNFRRRRNARQYYAGTRQIFPHFRSRKNRGR